MRYHFTTAAALVATLVGTSQGVNAAAFPAAPTGPILVHLNDDEQFSATNSLPFAAINAPGTEGNWGIVEISSIQQGTAEVPIGSDIQGGGPTLFVNGQNGGEQILGIFYGVHVDSVGTTSLASGGVLDLYGWTGSSQNVGTELTSSANLAKRTSQSQYTGFTCVTNTANCTFLAQLDFVYGINGAGDTTTTIVSPVNPATSDGTAQGYLSVDTADPGLWTTALNDNFFTLDPNNNPLPDTPDVRLSNSFTHNGAGAWSVAGTDIVGLASSDPARAAPIPEPASLSLLGGALVGFGAWRRRHKVRKA